MDRFEKDAINEYRVQKEKELIQLQCAREFLRQNKDLKSISLMKAVDPTMGKDELEEKIISLELLIAFIEENYK